MTSLWTPVTQRDNDDNNPSSRPAIVAVVPLPYHPTDHIIQQQRPQTMSSSLGLLRYQIFLCYGALFVSLWYASLQWQDALVQRSPMAKILIPWAPLWLILILGIYALSVIGYGMITSRDYPEAATELEQQIAEAKEEMRRRGIIE